MNGKQFIAILKMGFVGPEKVDSELVADESLQNNQARWSFKESILHVSPAARTLLLDPETFDAALEGLDIGWEPEEME